MYPTKITAQLCKKKTTKSVSAKGQQQQKLPSENPSQNQANPPVSYSYGIESRNTLIPS
jgi:hypothetical protein